MIAPVSERLEVVNLDESRRAATRHGASAPIAPPHEPPRPRRNVLGRPPRRPINRADPLRITFRPLDIRGLDRDRPARGLLPALLADPADGDRDLILRATAPPLGSLRVSPVAVEPRRSQRALDRLRAHRREHPVLFHARPLLFLDLLARLPPHRVLRRTQLEPHNELLQLRARRRARQIALRALRDQLLDLSQVLATTRIDPLIRGRRDRDPRNLANSAVRQLAGGKR